jgi:hypothetical protein
LLILVGSLDQLVFGRPAASLKTATNGIVKDKSHRLSLSACRRLLDPERDCLLNHLPFVVRHRVSKHGEDKRRRALPASTPAAAPP